MNIIRRGAEDGRFPERKDSEVGSAAIMAPAGDIERAPLEDI
jgi:hypothetical protein